MNILGINAYHGNASAAIVCDGQLVAAVEEERFNRVKYAAGFPVAAIQLLSGHRRTENYRSRSRGDSAESVGAHRNKTFLRDADAEFCARTR